MVLQTFSNYESMKVKRRRGEGKKKSHKRNLIKEIPAYSARP